MRECLDAKVNIDDTMSMDATNVRTDLRTIADHLPDSASYVDAMYELYVRMKIARGMQAAEEGRVIPHDEVKRRFNQ